jgi:hypothetical protein
LRLELRASGGPVCKDCGATELIHTSSTNEAFVADLTRKLSFYGAKDMADTQAVVDDKVGKAIKEIREDVNRRVKELREEVKVLYAAEIRDLEESLDGLLDESTSRIRFIQKRHVRRLRTEIALEVEQMLARTHLA